MSGIYDWEFDGSVDFAPLHYRLEKYRECEEIGKTMQTEEDAIKFLDAFDYIEYLSTAHLDEIDNWITLVKYQQKAFSLLQSDDVIFKEIIYPKQHRRWKSNFDDLRLREKVIMERKGEKRKEKIKQYLEEVKTFNTQVLKLNEKNKEMGYNYTHNLYWVYNKMLEHEMRQLLTFPKDFHERLDFLHLYGVCTKYDYYRR